ncbi:MAG: S9 family peptidase [Bacteroidetes bacterium]|nr:MAG: S9 family peptidase [Bacteroidota bacterium]TAG90289.1 MAG: S9 family peptidase [Bacteroidota bacterium]
MYNPSKKIVFLCLITFFIMGKKNSDAQNIMPPKAKKIEKYLEKHGHKRLDEYYWLNKREDKEVISYLEAENTYTNAQMKSTETLQNTLYEEMKGRIKETDLSVPVFENGYWYYSRYEEKKEYPIYCRKKGKLDAKEEIYLNVNELAEGKPFASVSPIEVSDDNKILAFAADYVGRNDFTIYFKELSTGKVMPEELKNTWGNMAWCADNKTVYYVTKDTQTLRANKVYKHILGTDVKTDEMIFEEKDETYNAGVGRTKSKKYVIISSSTTLANEYQLLEANKPNDKFQLFAKRERGHEYSIDHFENKFYITTNRNAINFKLMETSINQLEEKNWKEVIPHRKDVFLEGVEIFKEYMIVFERQKGLETMKVINFKTKEEYYIDFGESVYSANGGGNPEFNTTKFRFTFTSLITPNSTYEFDLKTKEKKLLKQQEVVGGYNPNDYVQERHYVKARDGQMVPVSLVYKKGLKKDGNNPTLQYAYGSYGSSTDVYFSTGNLSLLNRGFVYAIAHIRGGQEMGRNWYEDGKFFNKKNTFYDFIDCSEYLINEKFTSKDKLFAFGGSAGGLLMGAIANLRPDLYKGIIAAVPFVDVVTTMLDDSIPLTTGEYDEWGNPNDINYYIYMLSYSPYDQVEKKSYPNILVTTGLHDSQVQYFEPAKWVARLRDKKTDNNLLLLKTDMEAGHGGTTGRFKRLKETAFNFAFMLKLLEK